MKRTVLQYLQERFKSAHEPIIRAVVSNVRKKQFGKSSERPSKYGDCTTTSCRVADALKKRGYKSARVVGTSGKSGQLNSVRGAMRGAGGHSWVEIPEIDHYVDPTHDQFVKTKRKQIPTVKGNFPDNAVKIGSMKDKKYKQKYAGKVVDKDYVPHKRERLAFHQAELKKLPSKVSDIMKLPPAKRKFVNNKMSFHINAINNLVNKGY